MLTYPGRDMELTHCRDRVPGDVSAQADADARWRWCRTQTARRSANLVDVDMTRSCHGMVSEQHRAPRLVVGDRGDTQHGRWAWKK